MTVSTSTASDDPAIHNSQSHLTLSLKEQAITCALTHDWQHAIALNLEILKQTANDVETLNRLGFAYIKSGKYKEARKMLTKVKTLDPYNQIAIRNLEKLEVIKDEDTVTFQDSVATSPMLFLEDPGKTRLVACVNIAPNKILSTLHCGQEVFLKPKNHSVEIRDSQSQYLGALPDDLSFRLLKYMSANNTYVTHIKTVDKKNLIVFLREVDRGKKFANQPSFIASSVYQSYSRTSAKDTDKPDVTPTGEDDDTAEPDEKEST